MNNKKIKKNIIKDTCYKYIAFGVDRYIIFYYIRAEEVKSSHL